LLLAGTRYAVTVRGDEPYEQLEALKNVDATMVLAYLPEDEEKSSRVQASRRLFEFLEANNIQFPVIHHLNFPAGTLRLGQPFRLFGIFRRASFPGLLNLSLIRISFFTQYLLGCGSFLRRIVPTVQG
jgi:hypothetical protein